MYSDSSKSHRYRGRWRVAVCSALVLAALVSATAARAQDESIETLLAGISDDFRVLVLRDTVVLEPLAGEGEVSTIELNGGEIFLDGVAVSGDELEARLGDSSSSVRALAELEMAELRALLDGDAEQSEQSEQGTTEPESGADAEELEEAERSERRERSRSRRERADNRVVVASSLIVEEDEVSRDAVVFGGRLEVRGRVIGDAAVIGGSAEISGEIGGDLAVIGGSVELEDGAEVQGDVVSVGGSVDRADGAEVLGQVVQVPFDAGISFGSWDWDWDSDDETDQTHSFRIRKPWAQHSPFGHALEVGWSLLALGLFALLACLVLLLARNPVERVGAKAVAEPWKSGLVGLLAQILFVPLLVMVCLILLISVIGIPLLILVPFFVLGVVLAAFLGYTAVAYRLGNWLEERFGWSLGSPYLVLLLGIGLLHIWSLIAEVLDFGWGPLSFFAAMFALFGCLLGYLAWTVGLGAAILSRFGTRPGGEPAAALAAGTPPPPPGGDAPAGGVAPADWEADFGSEPEVVEPAEAPDEPDSDS